MSAGRLDAALGALALSMTVLAARRAREVVTPPTVPMPVVGRATALPPAEDGADLDATAELVVRNDPFRLSNRPATVPFLSAPSGGAPLGTSSIAPVSPPAARPVLVLKAIMGGPPWQAVIDGIPGQTSDAVVGPGTVFGTLRITSITPDAVIVQGADTTWTLSLRGRP